MKCVFHFLDCLKFSLQFKRCSTLWSKFTSSRTIRLSPLMPPLFQMRHIWNKFSAAADFNHRGQEGNWELNDLGITIIDCDTCRNDSLQNEWIPDLLVCTDNNLAAHRPLSTMIPLWPLLGALILEVKDVTGHERMWLGNPDQAMQASCVYSHLYLRVSVWDTTNQRRVWHSWLKNHHDFISLKYSSSVDLLLHIITSVQFVIALNDYHIHDREDFSATYTPKLLTNDCRFLYQCKGVQDDISGVANIKKIQTNL